MEAREHYGLYFATGNITILDSDGSHFISYVENING
jgi:hypothetical protein